LLPSMTSKNNQAASPIELALLLRAPAIASYYFHATIELDAEYLFLKQQ